MENLSVILAVSLLLFIPLFHGGTATTAAAFCFGIVLTQKPICSGGSTEVPTELRIPPSHGQPFSGFRVDLSSLRSSAGGGNGDLDSLLNGAIKKKLKIIPDDVTWGGQSDYVFSALTGDFMKPRINEVDELLAKGINVTIYNGQVDLICATKGTEAWVEKLKWEGLPNFLNKSRAPLYCGKEGFTRGFTRSYKNLHFYWILGAGHFVPVDQPCIALNMVADITQSPAAAAST